MDRPNRPGYWMCTFPDGEMHVYNVTHVAGDLVTIGNGVEYDSDALCNLEWVPINLPGMATEHIRFDEHGPLDAFEKVLIPAALSELEKGIEKYGNTWANHPRADKDMLWNAKHTISTHADTRIKQALEALDYGNIDEFVVLMGSAVGYLANAICKVLFIEREKHN